MTEFKINLQLFGAGDNVLGTDGVIDANIRTQLAVLQNAFGIYKGGL